jgi:hypothetical protein
VPHLDDFIRDRLHGVEHFREGIIVVEREEARPLIQLVANAPAEEFGILALEVSVPDQARGEVPDALGIINLDHLGRDIFFLVCAAAVRDAFIKALNSLKITLPGIMGGGQIGFNIPGIALLPITPLGGNQPENPNRFATGGVVSSPMLAMVGENGREAIMPLERNTGWIDELAGKLASVMGSTQHPATAGGVSVYIGNEKLDGYIVRANTRQALRSNGRV